MIAAVVTGNIWSTRRIDGLPSGALLEVEVPETGARLIAFDVLGSGVGEHVLVAQGSVAASWFTGPPPPVDALVIGSIDREPGDPTAPTRPDRPSDRSAATKRSNDVQ
jgi:ethanolamine utilization protein EutN